MRNFSRACLYYMFFRWRHRQWSCVQNGKCHEPVFWTEGYAAEVGFYEFLIFTYFPLWVYVLSVQLHIPCYCDMLFIVWIIDVVETWFLNKRSSDGDGFSLVIFLCRLAAIRNLVTGRQLMTVLLKLFGYCLKVKANRQELVKLEMNSVSIMLGALNLVSDLYLVLVLLRISYSCTVYS